jgi:MOSC domain-containing protein YiiM
MIATGLFVESLWTRSGDAEGNPMHRPLTRERVADAAGPVQLEPLCGMVASHDWHLDRQVVQRGAIADPENRALLLNSVENRAQVRSLLAQPPASLNDANMAGENVVVRGGVTSDLLCVGDLLAVQRGAAVVARFRVASPRWPCYKFDRRHGQRGSKEAKESGHSVQVACVDSGLGGVFVRVLEAGTIAVGDELVVLERPLPHLTLRRVSQLCYGGRLSRISCSIDDFNGSDGELEDLIACTWLAQFEWRDRLVAFRERRARNAKESGERLRRRARAIALALAVALLLLGARVLWRQS